MNDAIECFVRASDRLAGLSMAAVEPDPAEKAALRQAFAESLREACKETRDPEGRRSLEEALRSLESAAV